MTVPFTYPAAHHQRRHGPTGYSDYASYRPWLRDEFVFRCVFCLTRETWGPFRGHFAIDHFVPVALDPHGEAQYGNLLYSCVTCNGAKGDHVIPDPLAVLLEGQALVDPKGLLHATTRQAARLIDLLDLNNPRWIENRSLWIDVVSLARRFDPELLRRLLGYPADLPNLSTLQPPGNTRPEGIAESHFARRERGELPETSFYE